MGLFSSVNDFVAAQSRGLSKSFSTNFAHKRASTGVDWHVAGEIVMRVEDFSALEAREGFLFV